MILEFEFERTHQLVLVPVIKVKDQYSCLSKKVEVEVGGLVEGALPIANIQYNLLITYTHTSVFSKLLLLLIIVMYYVYVLHHE